MKKIFLIVILSILPAAGLSHPGKTDRYGGHQCLKGCEEWGLFYKEYHYHDKDGKPIRIGRDKRAPEPIVKDVPKFLETVPTTTEAQPEKPRTQVVTTYRYVTNVYEENIFPANPFLYILLILLLLLLILRMNRKREEG